MNKNEFINKFHDVRFSMKAPRYLIMAIKLPNGAIEIITNVDDLQEKFLYYQSAYDDEMRLIKNNNIRIIDCMVI